MSPYTSWRKPMRVTAIATVLVLIAIVSSFFPRMKLLAAPFSQLSSPFAERGRDARWQQDLAYLVQELPRLHIRAFHRVSKVAFVLKAAKLRVEIPTLTDTEIALRLMELVAKVGDGHTALNYIPFYQGENGWRFYPLNVALLDEGWMVAGAQAANQQLLGAQLIAINGMRIDDVFARIVPLVSADNEMQRRNNGAPLLITAEVLAALGVVENAESAPFTFILRDGQQVEIPLEPLAPRELQLQGIQSQSAAIPLALQNPQRWYWYTSLPEESALFFQYDVCGEQADLPFAEFSAELFETVDREELTRIVVDLRSNAGGNSEVLRPFLDELAERPELEVYVLIGRRTFSSAVLNAIELDQNANAILVGEATGGRPNHYGEMRSFQLPNSQLQISYATKYFRVLPDADPFSLEPEIETPITIANQFAGRDAALIAALAD